jgi:hypothetical protein
LFSVFVGLLSVGSADGATVTITPTNLQGAVRPDGQVTILRAANQNNQAVAANARITRRPTGEIDIVIDDRKVRAITVLVEAGGALEATLQNLLVIDQTVTAALPNADGAKCIYITDRCRIFKCRQR